MSRNHRNQNQKGNKWLGLGIVLFIINPALFFMVAMIAGVFYLVNKKSTETRKAEVFKPSRPVQQPVSRNATRYTTRQASFDECPQPIFCFHKDKAEHHVRRGREIDPWDRPDIDISKYQR